jgi:hypothetical protein
MSYPGHLHSIYAMETAESARQWAFLRFGVSFLALCVIAPLWIWVELPRYVEVDLTPVLAMLVTQYTGFRLAWLAYRGEPRLLAITFFVFIYIWGGLTAFAQTYTQIYPWGIRHAPDQPLIGMVQVLATLTVYELGQLYAMRRKRATNPNWTFYISHGALFWFTVAALPLMVVGMLILGGPDILFATRAIYNRAVALGTSSVTASLIGSSLFRVPAFVSFVLTLLVLRRDWWNLEGGRRRMLIVLLVYSFGLMFIGNYPLSLPRQWLGVVVLTPVFMLLPWRRWQIAALGVGLVALIIFVFPYTDAFRRQGALSGGAVERALRTSVIDNMLHKGDFDVYQQSLNAIVVTEREGYSYGKNFLGAALFWVPRKLWPDKPLGTGQTVAYKVFYPWHQTNLSSPLWMEAYWAFGWIGIIMIMGAYGLLSGRLDRSFVEARSAGHSSSAIMILLPFLSAYQFILVRGDILNGTAQAVPVIILFMLAVRFRRNDSRD